MDLLYFDENQYETKTCTIEGQSIMYREFGERFYCAKPKAEIQKIKIYVPQAYYESQKINGYTLKTAPIFMPNGVGGYMEGGIMEPGLTRMGQPNSVFEALRHGYVVAAAGIRGRNTGESCEEFFEGSVASSSADLQEPCGRAPALIVDYKAAIRYLRHNQERIPGDTEKIITSGTSAGGALSALAGTTGNAFEYEVYLQEIGAANARDDIFAASCYCPIINLEHADAAYEWQFYGIDDYHHPRFGLVNGKMQRTKMEEGVHDEKQKRWSKELKDQFPLYVNSLQLQDSNGTLLSLDENGEGSFKEHLKAQILASFKKEQKEKACQGKYAGLAVIQSAVEKAGYIQGENLDFEAFVRCQTRMKTSPAFDHMDLSSAENDEFDHKHFTEYVLGQDENENAQKADPALVHLLNPMDFVSNPDAAKHWRIRHGSFDRDTSLAIPTLFALSLQNQNKQVDFAIPWGLPHSGDYDLDALFAWIDSLQK